MKLVKLRGLLLLVTFFGAPVWAQDVVRIGAFNNRDPVQLIAREKGFFVGEKITVETNLVTNSVDLMRNFVNAKSDVIHTNADNIIAWAEG
jgi:hypothetical protein